MNCHLSSVILTGVIWVGVGMTQSFRYVAERLWRAGGDAGLRRQDATAPITHGLRLPL